MCDDSSPNVIDRGIIQKLNQKSCKIDKTTAKAYKNLCRKEEDEKKERKKVIASLNFWKQVGLQTLTSYISKFENDVTFIIFTIEFTLRNIAVHLKHSAETKLKLLGDQERLAEFQSSCQENLPFTRMFIKSLIKIDSIGMIICRRYNHSIIKLVGRKKAPYIVVINTPPLCNVQESYGCSWAVYKRRIGNECPFIEGSKVKTAGYAVIAATTNIVMAFKKTDEVVEFVLDARSGNFISLGRKWLPEYSSSFIFDDSKSKEFSPKLQNWIDLKKKSEDYRNWFTMQFILDIDKIVHYGGIYMSPPGKNSENGKLRLIFECIPLAYIIDKMGGKTTDGRGGNFLTVIPSCSREHSPFYGGSSRNIEEFLEVTAS